MNLLYFDAVNDWIVVSVYSLESGNLKELYSYKENHPKESSYRLIGDIAAALKFCGISVPDRIAVSIGPGSFTGIRITVSTARNLAQIWNIPVFGLDTNEIYASYYYSRIKSPVLLLMDARQKKVYAGYYDGQFKGSFDIRPEDLEKYFTESECHAKIYTNSQIVDFGEKMTGEIPDPSTLIQKKMKEITNANTESNNYKNLLPNYLRASYAEQL